MRPPHEALRGSSRNSGPGLELALASSELLRLSVRSQSGLLQAPSERALWTCSAGTVALKPVGCSLAELDTALLHSTAAWRDRGLLH